MPLYLRSIWKGYRQAGGDLYAAAIKQARYAGALHAGILRARQAGGGGGRKWKAGEKPLAGCGRRLIRQS